MEHDFMQKETSMVWWGGTLMFCSTQPQTWEIWHSIHMYLFSTLRYRSFPTILYFRSPWNKLNTNNLKTQNRDEPNLQATAHMVRILWICNVFYTEYRKYVTGKQDFKQA